MDRVILDHIMRQGLPVGTNAFKHFACNCSFRRRWAHSTSKEENATDIPNLKITPRSKDYSQWYLDVIAAAEMSSNSPVRGFMTIRPWGMAVWDEVREVFNKRIKATGAQNAYFPLLFPLSNLSKEADHVDGFAKECAVVTHHRLIKDPDGSGLIPDPGSKLSDPLVIRPTSETIIWDMFSKWIHSYRDLPLKVNQWANVVRWEMKTRPFLRTSEFLWQEGHTAHATREEALECSKEMIEVYADTVRNVLCAEETFTIEAMMQNGWALQAGTSHFLGQKFAEAFDVKYLSAEKKEEFVWATSWGVSTRLLGAAIMVHSDDKGLVLPQKIAPIQVVIVPLGRGKPEEAAVDEWANLIKDLLVAAGVRVHLDERDYLKPGAKYYHWERKGVPLRIEIGPREMKDKKVVLVHRYDGEKEIVDVKLDFGAFVLSKLDGADNMLYEAACARLRGFITRVDTYAEMRDALTQKKSGGFMVPWTCDAENEAAIKNECMATIRCYPDDENEDKDKIGKRKCFYSGKPATHIAFFARAF